MLIVGDNLAQLVRQFNICDHALVEQFSLKMRLGREYYRAVTSNNSVIYGNYLPHSEMFTEKTTITNNLIMAPGDRIIACSYEIYSMPLGYFGFVQTKGTLARMFVQATCNDGQIEPGFKGYVTFEFANLSPWKVELPKMSEVAQLFLFKTSSPVPIGYQGRYADGAKSGPTLPIFD